MRAYKYFPLFIKRKQTGRIKYYKDDISINTPLASEEIHVASDAYPSLSLTSGIAWGAHVQPVVTWDNSYYSGGFIQLDQTLDINYTGHKCIVSKGDVNYEADLIPFKSDILYAPGDKSFAPILYRTVDNAFVTIDANSTITPPNNSTFIGRLHGISSGTPSYKEINGSFYGTYSINSDLSVQFGPNGYAEMIHKITEEEHYQNIEVIVKVKTPASSYIARPVIRIGGVWWGFSRLIGCIWDSASRTGTSLSTNTVYWLKFTRTYSNGTNTYRFYQQIDANEDYTLDTLPDSWTQNVYHSESNDLITPGSYIRLSENSANSYWNGLIYLDSVRIKIGDTSFNFMKE